MYDDYDDEEQVECVVCKQLTAETITAETIGGHTVTIALCRGCKWNPLVVEFAEWLAGQPWLWLDDARLAELER